MPIAGQGTGIRAAVVAAVDRAFAEPVRLSFFKGETVDPTREKIEIAAVIRTASEEPQSVQSGPTSGWRTQVAPGEAELAVDASTYRGPPIRTGDRVCALDRPGRPWWKIVSAGDRGETRLTFRMAEL